MSHEPLDFTLHMLCCPPRVTSMAVSATSTAFLSLHVLLFSPVLPLQSKQGRRLTTLGRAEAARALCSTGTPTTPPEGNEEILLDTREQRARQTGSRTARRREQLGTKPSVRSGTSYFLPCCQRVRVLPCPGDKSLPMQFFIIMKPLS